MDPDGVCETFLAADKIINRENDASMTMEDIRKNSSFNGLCPNNKCVTDEQCIGAMTTYVFLKVRADKNNEHGEYFLMWLSDKLFKMYQKDKRKGENNRITLDEAYKKYLDKDIGDYKYWNRLDNVKGLKDANLSHMNEFYKLLSHICKTIIHHKFKHTGSTNLHQNYTNSSNQYMLLYQKFSKCDSYLHLLDNLKKTYEDFRTTIKNDDPNLASSLQTLTTIENTDSYFVKGFSTFDFSNSKCQSEYDDSILKKWEKTEAQRKQKDNGAGTLESKDKVVGDVQNKSNPKGSEHTDPGSDIGNKTNLQSNPSSHTPISGTNQGGGSDNNQGPQKPVESPVVKSENCGIKVKGNETTGICDIYVPKEYKQVGILIIVILIPITLAIMYKYLPSGRKKELKRKKNMKKVINLMEGKRQMQIIIKSSSQKKQTKKYINPVYGEKSPSINIYKLMQADPVPFINLIFLLIFLFIKEKTILWKDIFN
ncbi:CIR protein [Plasmodium chabaudi chabaudi]|uniref:CIR protein n=1 Tax=Plasmodium chabaudi chabaudi TaxID=31271 RepID=A0A4V0K3Q5_PLACU|nr:CIR protein [Plasmodium chabaudi chabaudi]VTZ67112.1 CIR protein [Plasmodium chabaudi chabaudi]|eukprot:XP_016652923.1 CIR protein [Plasmodium chabaudi chabaudi]